MHVSFASRARRVQLRLSRRRCFCHWYKALSIAALLIVLAPAGLAAARVKSGTAFFVSTLGYLVTSAHVIAGCSSVSAWRRDGEERGVQLVAADRSLDIALLRTVGEVPTHIRTPYPTERPSIGEPVYTIGYGVLAEKPREPFQTSGTYLGRRFVDDSFQTRALIRARLRAGESGGAVVDKAGALLGMIIGRLADRPDFGVMVPALDIERFVSQFGVRFDKPAGSFGPELLLDASVLLQCLHPKSGASGRAR